MAYGVFTLPVRDPGAAETELNGFLASHRVLSVDRRFALEDERSFWSFCVDFVDARRGSSSYGGGKYLEARPDRLPRGAQRRVRHGSRSRGERNCRFD